MTDQPELHSLDQLKYIHGATGIYVRATNPRGKAGTYDVAELTAKSLLAWAKTVPTQTLIAALVERCRKLHEDNRELSRLAQQPTHSLPSATYPFTAEAAQELNTGAIVFDEQGDYWEKIDDNRWELYQRTCTFDTLPEDGEMYTLIHEHTNA